MSIKIHKAIDWDSLGKFYVKKFSKRTGNGHWVFRGEKRSKTRRTKPGDIDLQTSLEKAFDRFKPKRLGRNGLSYKRQELEIPLLREFQRKAHHHLPYVPAEYKTMELLTFMQHYGGPTRLLDWTYSFYVAVFFAVARLNVTEEYGHVWAVNAEWLAKKEESLFTDVKLKELRASRKKDAKNMDAYHDGILEELFSSPKQTVVLLNAFKLNARLIIQQGTFLVQGDINKSFGDNLKAMGTSDEVRENLHKIVIKVDGGRRNEMLKELNAMNINNATLFPGIQGFAESLETQLAYPEKFGIDKK